VRGVTAPTFGAAILHRSVARHLLGIPMSARSLVLSRSAHAATPGKQHKAFDALVRKLERERARLQDWNDERASLSSLIHGELPARRRIGCARRW
jgi:hypothetical protein